MKKTACFILLLFAVLSGLAGQESLKSLQEEYYDFQSLLGNTVRPTLGYRTLSDSVWTLNEDEDHVWKNNSLGTSTTLFAISEPATNFFLDGIDQSLKIRFYGPEWYNSYNKAVPFGQNDGVLWQGVGYNTSFSTGVRLEGYGFELTFKPQIAFSQNNAWDFMPGVVNPYGYFFNYYPGNPSTTIDIVQRYGDKPFYTFSWGDSEIRYTWNTFTFGFGTQSPWLGPSWLNPMLGSNTADPYPKFDVGLRKTSLTIPGLDWYLGDFEARIWLGRLTQSDYFDCGVRTDDRMISMGSFSFSPANIKGFTIGMNRLFITYWDKQNLSYLLRLFNFKHANATGSGNDEDQKAALYADWLFPEAGFEVYGELGVDDFSAYEIPNPFHTAIYTLGVKQIIPHSDRVYGLFNLEWNSFEMSQDFQMQWNYGGYYFHHFVNQGFTNNGQIVGAGTGYMGNSQFIGYTLYYPKGNTMLKIHRYCNDNNYIYNKAIQAVNTDPDVSDNYALFETYISVGLETSLFITPQLCLTAGADGIMRVFPKYSKAISEWETTASANFGLKYTF